MIQRLPDFSLCFLTFAFLLTVAVTMGVIAPQSLLLDWNLVIAHHEVHRIITSFIFFGPLSLKWLMFVISNAGYLVGFERGMGGRTREFYACIVYVVVMSLVVSAFIPLKLLSMLFFGATTCLWALQNPNVIINVMMFLPVKAQFYPVINIVIALISGDPVLIPLIAMGIGFSCHLLLGKGVFAKITRAKLVQ